MKHILLGLIKILLSKHGNETHSVRFLQQKFFKNKNTNVPEYITREFYMERNAMMVSRKLDVSITFLSKNKKTKRKGEDASIKFLPKEGKSLHQVT